MGPLFAWSLRKALNTQLPRWAAAVVIGLFAVVVVLANWGRARRAAKQLRSPGTRRGPSALAQACEYFAPMGFYADMAGLTTREAVEQIQLRYAEHCGRPLKLSPLDPRTDLEFLQRDESRAWWCDLEADVHPDNQVYAEALSDWRQIGRGAFDVEDVVETWRSPRKPGGKPEIDVSFTLSGQRHSLRPEWHDDWFDEGVLDQVNRIIAPSGYRFERYAPEDQTRFVLALTREERRKLERDRGWEFV